MSSMRATSRAASTSAVAGLVGLLISGCGVTPAPYVTTVKTAPATLTVLAAASLTTAFTSIGHRFEQAHPGITVRFSFAGTQVLVTQIENGAPADVFASADVAHMSTLATEGKVETSAIFARNRLVIVTPKANPAGLFTPFDLARPGIKLDLAAPAVPAGASAQKAIDKLALQPGAPTGFAGAVRKNVVSQEDNVEAVVTRIATGEADAGIVYASDLSTPNGKGLHVIPVPDPANVINTYPIAGVKGSAQLELAHVFIDFVLHAEGQTMLRQAGFLSATS
jgi:molybdate transport system substrate-binding protein